MLNLKFSKIFFNHVIQITRAACMQSRRYRPPPETSDWQVNEELVILILDSAFIYDYWGKNIYDLRLPYDMITEALDYMMSTDTNMRMMDYDSRRFIKKFNDMLLETHRHHISNIVRNEIKIYGKREAIMEFERKATRMMSAHERFENWYDNGLYHRQKIPDVIKLPLEYRPLKRQRNTITPGFAERCYEDGITFQMVLDVFIDDMANRDRWIEDIKELIAEIGNPLSITPEEYVDVFGWRTEHVRAATSNNKLLENYISTLPRRSLRIMNQKRKRDMI